MWLVQLATFFSSKLQVLKKPSALMTQWNPTQRGKIAWVEGTRITRDFSKVTQELPSHREESPLIPQIPMRKAISIFMITITANLHWPIINLGCMYFPCSSSFSPWNNPRSKCCMPIYGGRYWGTECLSNCPRFYHQSKTVENVYTSKSWLQLQLS